MKPFNLEEALAGKPVVTRSSKDVKELTHFKTQTDQFLSVVGVINGQRYSWAVDGKGAYRDLDLFMKPEKKQGWINIYRNDGGTISTSAYPWDTEQQAREHVARHEGYVTTVMIELEE